MADSLDLTVLIPTLNEEESLKVLLPRLKEELDKLSLKAEILVVDGGSKDGTVGVAEGHGARVCRQRRQGFGAAFEEGFAESRGEWIQVMDADGSHPPADLARLWESRQGVDLVVGSRYCPGGSAAMSPERYWLSRALNFVTGWFLEFPIRDASSGFRLYRRAALKDLAVSAVDFSAQQEILARLLARGAKVTEIPFRYEPRIGGESKAKLLPWALSSARTFFLAKLILRGPADLLGLWLVLGAGLMTGFWGIGWGIPGRARARVLPAGALEPAEARRLADAWKGLYGKIRVPQEDKSGEPPGALAGFAEIAPGWKSPPKPLLDSICSFMVRSAHPDERLDAPYGGAFVYPLAAWLWLCSRLGLAELVPDIAFYLAKPEAMGRLYELGRGFVLVFHLLSLGLLYALGRRLGGWKAGLAASSLFLLSPLTILHSHLVKPDALAAFFALSAWLYAHRASKRDGRSFFLLSGLAAGLAFGANLSFVPLALLPLAAWSVRREPSELRYAFFGLASSSVGLLLAGDAAGARLGVPNPLALARMWVDGLGPLPALVAGAGLLVAPLRPHRRLLGVTGLAFVAIIAVRFSSFTDPQSLRLYYPAVGLGLALGAELALSLGRSAGPLLLAAALIDAAPRALAHWAALGHESGPSATRRAAADWIEREIPIGASLGLLRFPEPSTAPVFALSRYRLLVFSSPAALPEGRRPDWIVVDARHRAALGALAASYELAKRFQSGRVLWGKVPEELFVGPTVELLKRRDMDKPPKES